MASPGSELNVQIERSRAALRVTATVLGEAAGPSVEVTFSGGAEGVWFRLVQGPSVRVFARGVVEGQRPLAALLRLIGDEVELPKAPNHALLALLFQSLLVYVARMSNAVPRPRWGRPLRDRRIERALELLNRDLAKYWTVEQLARAVGLSRPVFAREFVRVLQLSPMRYLLERRMQAAADLLLDTEASLGEVATHVGYQSEFAFGRAFKRHHGIAPGTFRRQSSVAYAGALRLAA